MILDAVADPATGVFSVGTSALQDEPMRVRPSPGIMTGLLGERRHIHTVTRQQRRQASRSAKKAARTAR